MKHWRETQRIFAEIQHLTRSGRRCALATVVKIEGSAYRRPGAKLLIRDDGTLLGNVSGGCLEADLAEIGRSVLASGRARPVHYETNGPEDELWGLGLGCNGKIDVMVRPCSLSFQTTVAPLLEQLAGEQPFSYSQSFEDEQGTSFTESFVPPPRLFVFGAGDDALALVALADQTGFRVTVVDHRPALLTAERFPAAWSLILTRPEETIPVPLKRESYAVLKTHSLAHDRAWFARCAQAGVRYLGLMGPQARRLEVMRDGPAVPPQTLFGPVGLDLGADGAEQIAVSIVGELLAVHHARSAGHLRDRTKPIH